MAYTFISGATGGIGKAFAVAAAARGYDLFLTGRSETKLTALKEEIAGLNPTIDIKTCAADLTSVASRENLIAFADEYRLVFERIINVAGVDIQKPFSDYEPDKVLMQIRVNVEATISLTHAFLERGNIKEIITISSMSGVTPMPYFALYSATKACLTNFFQALRLELKDRKVKVTTVLPGGVYTRPDIIEDIKGQGLWGKLSAKSPEFVAEKSFGAVKRNKAKYIPGFFNKFLNFLMKLLPLSWSMRYIRRRWRKIRKDAF